MYKPNLVGYTRVAIFAAACLLVPTQPMACYALFLLNFTLDAVDGLLARKLNQVSAFGAFLDVLIDVLARGYLWSLCAAHPLGYFVPFLEMTTFAATHAGADSEWKSSAYAASPWWVQAVMARGFKQPAGCLAMYGLYGAPLWLFARRYLAGSVFASPWLGWPAIGGRLLCVAVEVWSCMAHVLALLERDAARLSAARQDQ